MEEIQAMLEVEAAEDKFQEAADTEVKLIKMRGVSEQALKQARNNRVRAFYDLVKAREALERISL